MANKCKIPRVNSNSSPTGEELQHFAIAKIIPSFMAIYNNNDYKTNGVISPSKSRLAVIDFIKSLGSDYYSSEYSYLEEAFKWCLDQPAFKFFEKITPKQSFQHIIKARGTAEQISS
jgi:hypothetical protein